MNTLYQTIDRPSCTAVRYSQLTTAGKAPVRAPQESEAVTPEVLQEKPTPPRRYNVVVLNDDYTPMDFVVQVLELFFGLGREQATRIMLKVHTEGRAVCGVYSRDIAEAKAEQVNRFARDNKHPLLCLIEIAESGNDDGRTSK